MATAARQARFRIGIDTGGTFTDIVSVDSGSGAMRVTKVASTPVQSGDRPRARRRGDPRRDRRLAGRRRRARARHHGRDQRAAARRDQLARPHRHRRLPAHPRDRPPVGAGGLRQFLFLGEAGAARAAASRARGRRAAQFPRRGAAAARRGERARGGARSSAATASARSASASSTPTPMPRTSAASPKSSPRNIRTARCRSPARCCRNIANTSAR